MSEINEVTMKEFFQAAIDKFAELSTQANKVDYLEQRIRAMEDRIGGLETENANLRADLDGTTHHAQELQSQLNATQNSLEAERAVSHGLRETIVSRDSRVQELASYLDDTRHTAETATQERDDARSEVNDLKAYVDNLKDQVRNATEGRDHWHQVADGLERTVAELQARLDRINSVLNPAVKPVASVA